MFLQHILFRIVGLLPWTMNQSFNVLVNHNNSDKLCRLSFLGLGYSFLLFSVIIILSVYKLIESPSVQIQADSMLTATLTTKLEFITQLGVLLIPIIFICRQTLMTSVINRLADVDERLKRCPGYAIESNLTAVIVFVVHLVLISRVGILIGQYHLPLVLIRFSPGIIASWSVTQFSTLLILITKRIKRINTALVKLGGNIRNNQAQSRSLSILCELMVHEIKNLKNGFVELFEVCEDIKDFYGLPVLIVIIYYGLQGILVSYFAISSMIQGQSHTTTMHLLNGMRLLLTAFVFTVLTSSVTSTVRESLKTANIVHLLIDRYPMDQKIQDYLLKFSHHLVHLKFNFTACDIVPLNRSFLAVIVGTIATYLIIIFQFRISA
ncbi:GSCOCT00014142001.2-RA-CDS, partial [Cotesia congregata]